MMDSQFTNALMHEGVLRKSGRYPWGSGDTPNQRNRSFLDHVTKLERDGLSQVEIAKGMGISTTQLRATKSVAKNALKKADISRAMLLKQDGHSNMAIGKEMGINESSVRALLNPATQERNEKLVSVSNMLKDQVAEKKYLDVGVGTESHIGVSGTKLATAVAQLKEEGYELHKVKVPQLGVAGNFTEMKVLVAPGTTYKELMQNQDKIRSINKFSDNDGISFLGVRPPLNVDSKRIAVKYAEEGGTEKDGVIELRRGVDDISLGNARYAQVRIAVDGSHYLKGMAMYADDLPDGIDLRFNTNKKKADLGPDKLEAMKKLKEDEDNPFGATVRQKIERDADGNERVTSALNIVNEEGNWYEWSRDISSQAMSKQPPGIAKKQLDLSYDIKKAEYDDIMALTNPIVKRRLLQAYSDGVDASAVHLQAAALPRTRNHVILPIKSINENEIYAPNYRDGEKVVLIRHPHGGIFEIPELTVNNRNREAGRVIKNAKDAVGIHFKVAERLSGADFDGDTVLVIPNNSRSIKTKSTLAGLKDFDPQSQYKKYEGMKPMTPRQKGIEMGGISNLITDMTIQGANDSEIARAVRHSMVVIDAEKHELNWKQSATDNRISELKTRYQGRSNAGASTLISRAGAQVMVDNRKPRTVKNGGPIDALTGKKMYESTGESYTLPERTKVTKRGPVVVPEKTVVRQFKSKQMAETDDAFTLVSKTGTVIESVYAEHANKLKSLANTSRKSMIQIKPDPLSPSAKAAYKPQVDSLKAKLAIAKQNAPLERQAQLLANAQVKARVDANPGMDPADLKKIKGQALTRARQRTGAEKQRIDITPIEWEAIQSGAISSNFLDSILANTDLDKVKALATPRTKEGVPTAKLTRAKTLLDAGYTQDEVASAIGVSVSTLFESLK